MLKASIPQALSAISNAWGWHTIFLRAVKMLIAPLVRTTLIQRHRTHGPCRRDIGRVQR